MTIIENCFLLFICLISKITSCRINFCLTHTHTHTYSRHITGTSFGSGGSGGRKRLQSLAKPYSSKPDEINSWSSFKEHMKLGFEMQNIYYVRDDKRTRGEEREGCIPKNVFHMYIFIYSFSYAILSWTHVCTDSFAHMCMYVYVYACNTQT
jgi:hypothetical protein